MTQRFVVVLAVLSALLAASLGAGAEAPLSPALRETLSDSRYVYIASTRKDGSLGAPAEIWFMFHDDAVWVMSPPTTWRAKRIRWGRPQARIWVGSREGPAFDAVGAIVRDAAAHARLLETFAEKYPARWAAYADSFRDGYRDGSRVLIRYTPTP